MPHPATLALAALLGFATLPCPAFQSDPPSGAPRDTYVLTLPGSAAPVTARRTETAWTNVESVPVPLGPVSHGLMWKASSPTNTAYLLGSIHLASKEIYPLPPQIEEAFQNSSVLVVEVDMNKVDRQQLQAQIAARGLYPPDDSLWNHVSPDTRNLAIQFCAQNGLNPELFARMRPWLATVTASAAPMQTGGMDPALGIDKHFLDSANGMRVDQLETADSQLRVLADLPEIKQEQSLAATIKGAAVSQHIGKALQAAWVSGDARKLDALSSGAWQGAAELRKRVFADRNPHMADGVEQCLKGGDRCFVIVGAGHLVGKDGVVRLLQSRGYQVEQIFSTN